MKKTDRNRGKWPDAIVLSYVFTLFCGLALIQPGSARAQAPASPEGLWETLDDHSGKPRGLVRLYRQGDVFFGRLEATLVPEEADERCSECKDERRDQPVVGMVILRNLKAQTDGFGGGDILDPDTGTVYDCVLHLEGDGKRLIVRGYVGLPLFGRSQTWLRAE